MSTQTAPGLSNTRPTSLGPDRPSRVATDKPTLNWTARNPTCLAKYVSEPTRSDVSLPPSARPYQSMSRRARRAFPGPIVLAQPGSTYQTVSSLTPSAHSDSSTHLTDRLGYD